MRPRGQTVAIVLGLATLVTAVVLVSVLVAIRLRSPPTLRAWGAVHQITIDRWYAGGPSVTITSPADLRRIVRWLDAVMDMPSQKDFRRALSKQVSAWTIRVGESELRIGVHQGHISVRGTFYELQDEEFEQLRAIVEPLTGTER